MMQKIHGSVAKLVNDLLPERRVPFWRDLADKNYTLLKANPRHPSLRLKKIDDLWAVRVGAHYRALGVDVPDGIYWIWIGTHADYDTFIA